MQCRHWLHFAAAGLLLGLVGCTSSSSSGGSGNDVVLTIRGVYETRTPGINGFSEVQKKPARYCKAEVINTDTNEVYISGYLGASGVAQADIPKGMNVHVRLQAEVRVPGAVEDEQVMRGSVKKGVYKDAYESVATFKAIPTWNVESESRVLNSNGEIELIALENPSSQDHYSGAFAIADQMADFALMIKNLKPGYKVPDLHAFWAEGNAYTWTAYVASDKGGKELYLPSLDIYGNPKVGDDRTVFQLPVRYAGPSAQDLGADAYNSGRLQKCFSHVLFDPIDGAIRSDNKAYEEVDPFQSSESSIAFLNGYATFLAAAIQQNPNFYRVGSDGRMDGWSLDKHDAPLNQQNEFHSASIARSLWGIWKNGYSFEPKGLSDIWAATNREIANQPYEYPTAPLACYPTYLRGLSRISGLANVINAELSAESIPYPLDAYFFSEALWIPNLSDGTVSGTLNSDFATLGYFGRGQSQAFRVQHFGGNRSITLTASVPLVVEIFNSGLFESAVNESSTTVTIPLANQPSGEFVIRVSLLPWHKYSSKTVSYGVTLTSN